MQTTILKITILWHEGYGQYDGKEFTSWDKLQHAFNRIYKDHGDDLGYSKVKVQFDWTDGTKDQTRIDVSNAGCDYCPKRETIREHIQNRYKLSPADLDFPTSGPASEPDDLKQIKAVWNSRCQETGQRILKGEQMLYNYTTKKCYALDSETAQNHAKKSPAAQQPSSPKNALKSAQNSPILTQKPASRPVKPASPKIAPKSAQKSPPRTFEDVVMMQTKTYLLN